MQKETNDSDYNNSNSATWKPFLQLFQYSKTYKCILSSFAHPSKLLQQPVHGRDEKNLKKKRKTSYFMSSSQPGHVQLNQSNYLFIIGWIPIRIKQNQSVSAYQIETTATSLAAQEKCKFILQNVSVTVVYHNKLRS